MSDELTTWLRSNSSGIYRKAALAADEIESLRAEIEALKQQVEQVEQVERNAVSMDLLKDHDICAVLNEPEVIFPGNFDTAKRANAFLFGLCQDAKETIESLRTEIEALKHHVEQGNLDAEAMRVEFCRAIAHAISLNLEAAGFLRCWNEGDWAGCSEFDFAAAPKQGQ